MITNAGGVAAVVDFIKESKGNVRLPGIMMLGYVAAHSETLAWSVVVSKVCTKLFAFKLSVLLVSLELSFVVFIFKMCNSSEFLSTS